MARRSSHGGPLARASPTVPRETHRVEGLAGTAQMCHMLVVARQDEALRPNAVGGDPQPEYSTSISVLGPVGVAPQ